MPVSTKPHSEDLKAAAARAREWRAFRKDYLYSQHHLAYALKCSRRTIAAIEGAEVVRPSLEVLRRFRRLKRRQEKLNGAPQRDFTNVGQLVQAQRGA